MKPIGWLALLVALMLTVRVAAAQDQAPTRVKPFDSDGVEKQGLVSQSSANKTTGQLKASINVQCQGYNTMMAGAARPYVRWHYTLGGTTEVRAAVVVQYTLQYGSLDNGAGDPTCGMSYSDVRLGVRITDTSSSDNPVRYPIEAKGTAQAIVPLTYDQSWRGQSMVVAFKPGHSYYIDVYLHVQAGVSGGESLGVQGTAGGDASASAAATIESIRLKTMANPWIRTSITDLYSPAHDTYDRYEQLFANTNRQYGTACAWVEVSAGGRYDANASEVVIDCSPAPYVKVGPTCPAATPSPTSVRLHLPDCYDLPLEGKTWRFLAYFDAEFQTPRDNVSIGPPLFRPCFETMFAAGQFERAAVLDTGLEPGHGIHLVASRSDTTFTPKQFYDPGNWSVMLPASWFAGTATRAKPKKPNKMKVQLYVPPGQTTPVLDKTYLTVQTTRSLSLGGDRPEFSTEPVALISIEELWKMVCKIQLPNDLTLCANPPFIQLIQRLETDAEAWRLYLDNLYLKAPDGTLYKVTDLDEERPQLALAGPNGTTPIWLPRRVRQWIRRAVVISKTAELLADSRPTQKQTIRVSGHVQNTAGQFENAHHERDYYVVLDLMPRPQPWPIQEMTTLP